VAEVEGSESYAELARLRSTGDPERDARREAYQEQERRRAARALDRYVDLVEGDRYGPRVVAGERFVEAVGDYVLSRLHHKGHYGVSDEQVVVDRYLACDGMAHLYDCCPAGPEEPHTANCPKQPSDEG
jgi:hypothetical protein